MFAKRTILASLLVVAFAVMLPNWLFAQEVVLQNDDDTPCGYTSGAVQGWIWGEKFFPCYERFKIDSVSFYVYRYSGSAASLSYRIHIYEDQTPVTSAACPGGQVTCDGPGPQRWADATDRSVAAPAVGQYVLRTVNVPDCTLYGNFIIGVEVRNTSGAPSLFMDCQLGPPCCTNFYRYGSTWYEHWDFWYGPADIGYNIIRAKGTNQGNLAPGNLQIAPRVLWFGDVDITYNGGTEVVSDSIKFTGKCATMTINSVTCLNPDFTFDASDVLGDIAPDEEKWLHIDFTTSNPGLSEADIIVTYASVYTDTCHVSGRGFGGHWLENFTPYPEPYPGPAESGDWFVIQYNCTTSADNGNWGIYYDFGWANESAAHQPTTEGSGCLAEDMLFSSPIANPGNSLKISWANYQYYNDNYYFQGLYYTSPNDTLFHLVSEITPSLYGQWTEVGPYYVVTDSDSVMLGYYYAGEFATRWAVDDIMVDSLPPQPPILTHEHHTDDGPATWIDPNCVHLTVQCLDPNNDLSYVKLWYKDLAGGSWASLDMSAVSGCEYMNLYEVNLCDLTVCHAYGYYFEANDVAATGPSYLPATAPTDYYRLDIMDNTTDQLGYDDGGIYYVQYFFDYVGRFAVRFTPTSYPYTLGGAMVVDGSPYQSFPDNDHEDIVCEVYDDNGVSGLPGTLLYGPDAGGTSWNPGTPDCDDYEFASWVYFKIEPCVTINDGDFYISFRNRDGSVSPDMDAFGFDDDGPSSPYRSYCFYPTGGGGGFWGLDTLTDPNENPASDFMCRALACACVPSAPTNVTVIYNAATGNAEVRWTDLGQNQSYKIYRSTTSPFSGYALLATVGTGVQLYLDPIGANTKAFYRIQGSCDAPSFAPPTPPSEPMAMVGPVRVPGAGRTASLAVGQKWSVAQQLESGALPKTLSKAELLQTKKVSPTMNLLEHFAR